MCGCLGEGVDNLTFTFFFVCWYTYYCCWYVFFIFILNFFLYFFVFFFFNTNYKIRRVSKKENL